VLCVEMRRDDQRLCACGQTERGGIVNRKMFNGSVNNKRQLKEHRRKNGTNVGEKNHSNRNRRHSVLRAACVCVCVSLRSKHLLAA